MGQLNPTGKTRAVGHLWVYCCIYHWDEIHTVVSILGISRTGLLKYMYLVQDYTKLWREITMGQLNPTGKTRAVGHLWASRH
jgi:hypothetical protein